jgi:hydroxyethylthiazole kinase-like uncharacterized protein yjeF
MKIFTAAQMRELDRLTVERCGIPYPTLMETAGSRVVEAILSSGKAGACAVFCGKGNNGGDGAVIARLLWLRGIPADVFLFGRLEETKGEARTNFEIVRNLAHASHTSGGGEITFTEVVSAEQLNDLRYHGLVVDALFGTGLTRPVEGLAVQAILAINKHKRLLPESTTVISVDIPSGLSSDLPNPIGPCVQADITVSFTGPKLGNVLAPAFEANGHLIIAHIGTPDQLLAESEAQLYLTEDWDVREFLNGARRTGTAHKTSVGDVLLIAGSRGKTGAAALSAETVLRAGAGLVTVATARSAQALLVTQCKNEVMTEGLDENEAGAITDAALDRALQLAAKRTVLALGPGLSSSDEATRRFVREFVARRTAPLVIDADGLNALAPWPFGIEAELNGSDELPIIITPHPGEMARLTGKTNAEVVADRLNIAREFATKHHVITVLKGSRSLIAAPNGEVYVNPTGNAGMATAGSGDVLTGLLAGLLAQMPAQRPQAPLDATVAAVYLHGHAGDLAAAKLGQRSLIASDLIAHLPEAILQVGGTAECGQANPITTI